MEKQTYLTFLLGQEYFAVNVSKVLEVLERQHITKVPQTPDHILGIINFRGEILPVADTRRKFNLPPQDYDVKHFVIVYEIGSSDSKFTIAATADAVRDVIEVADNEIKPVPEMGINYNSKFISGAIRRDDKFILMLDIEKVFSIIDTEVVKAAQIAENTVQTA
jgi:purine-binding chemotaxis protein CheW